MSSLRGRLFLILVATTSLIWLAATGWIYLGTKNELERVLDTRLQEAARMVASLVQDDTSAPGGDRGRASGRPARDRQLRASALLPDLVAGRAPRRGVDDGAGRAAFGAWQRLP
jgi:hypothetical protein